MGLRFEPKQVGKGRECVKIKVIILFRSYQTRNTKLQKNSKKIQNIKQFRYGYISGQNRMEKDVKKWK